MGVDGEIVAYMLTTVLAVSAGLVMGGWPSNTHRWMRLTSGLLIVAVVVVAGFTLGRNAPWVGPIFALVCMSAGTLAAAAAKRNDPAIEHEPFGSRLIAVLNERRGVALEERDRGASDSDV